MFGIVTSFIISLLSTPILSHIIVRIILNVLTFVNSGQFYMPVIVEKVIAMTIAVLSTYLILPCESLQPKHLILAINVSIQHTK